MIQDLSTWDKGKGDGGYITEDGYACWQAFQKGGESVSYAKSWPWG